MTPSVEAQVRSFRVAELKDCLVRIGLPRTGKKADQQQRILDYLRDLRALRGTEQQQETAGQDHSMPGGTILDMA